MFRPYLNPHREACLSYDLSVTLDLDTHRGCLQTWRHSSPEGQVGAIEHIGERSRETPDEWVISLQLPEAGNTVAVGPGALEAGG